MKKLICFAFVACAALAQAVSVSNVSARQRWPWNNLVDVSFDIEGTAGAAYSVEVRATCANGAQELTARTLLTEPIAKTGANALVWDFGADYPNFRADDMKVSVLVTPFSDATPVYLVIDVSGGVSATSYPVRYTTVDPVHTVGANDPCKTTEIWLKRVKAGGGTISGLESWGFKGHTFKLTEDYYLGIFPVTQAQWEKVGSGLLEEKGLAHSFFTNPAYAATRPVDNVGFWSILGTDAYPDSQAITRDSFFYRLRNKTGLANLFLPSAWQYQWAARAGDLTGARYSGCVYRNKDNSMPAGKAYADRDANWSEDYGTSYVDRYVPNAWGFYSMIGNVWEWTPTKGIANADLVDNVLPDDYKGLSPFAYNKYAQAMCQGGSWTSYLEQARYYGARTSNNCYCRSGTDDNVEGQVGFRICLPIPNAAQ